MSPQRFSSKAHVTYLHVSFVWAALTTRGVAVTSMSSISTREHVAAAGLNEQLPQNADPVTSSGREKGAGQRRESMDNEKSGHTKSRDKADR